MKEAEIRINLDLDNPLDKSIYDYVLEIGNPDAIRDFLFQSILLNMKIPQMYQLFYLRNLFDNSLPTMPTQVPSPTVNSVIKQYTTYSKEQLQPVVEAEVDETKPRPPPPPSPPSKDIQTNLVLSLRSQFRI